jgi:hypothetical protein
MHTISVSIVLVVVVQANVITLGANQLGITHFIDSSLDNLLDKLVDKVFSRALTYTPASRFAARASTVFHVRAPRTHEYALKKAISVIERCYYDDRCYSTNAATSDDRCYYGDVDADGTLIRKEKKQRGPALKPNRDLLPQQVVAEQFEAFSSGTSTDLEDAFAFVSPKIKERNGVNMKMFRAILSGTGMEGIIGCTEWEVMGEPQFTSEDTALVGVRIIPKPIPGCVRVSGVADQGGITWPAFYKWQLGLQPTGAELAGCWMLEQMIPCNPESVKEDPLFGYSAEGKIDGKSM